MRIAIIGGGVAGLTAAYELARISREGTPIEVVLYESSNRLGGLIETVREGGFTIECGPDAWLTAKPWAAELAEELGLASELIPSNDATRQTWIYLNNQLVPMPPGMNMMVPTNLDALENSPLFTATAIAAYRAEPTRAAEFLAAIPPHDESVADFTLRHFGSEVLHRVAAPLLSGVFGGDVHKLSTRAVLPVLIALEREHGSLIAGLQASLTTHNSQLTTALFTTLRSGLGTLVDRLVAAIPPHWLRLNTTVNSLQPASQLKAQSSQLADKTPQWTLSTSTSNHHRTTELFDAVLLATSLDVTRQLLSPIAPDSARLLPTESSSAVLVAFCFPDATRVPLPSGFGFLVPPNPIPSKEFSFRPEGHTPATEPKPSQELSFRPEGRSPAEEPGPYQKLSFRPDPELVEGAVEKPATPSPQTHLLAATFADQKFPHRVPPNGRLIRAFFGGASANRLARCNNDEIAAIARLELTRILNSHSQTQAPSSIPTPLPTPVLTIVRRWPSSLPQYSVGHLDRVAEFETHLRALPGLTLLGNALHGVGLPDLIHAARKAARNVITSH